MDVGRQAVRLVERADAHEAHRVAGAGVVAPQRDAALRAARDLLALAAVRRRVDDVGLAVQQAHAVGLDHRVERERRAGLALAPAAMAAVHEQRLARHAVAHRAAGAAALERESIGLGHGVGSALFPAIGFPTVYAPGLGQRRRGIATACARRSGAILSMMFRSGRSLFSLARMNAASARVEELLFDSGASFRDLARAAEAGAEAATAITAAITRSSSSSRASRPRSLRPRAQTSVSRRHVHQSIHRLPDPRWVEEVQSPDDHRKLPAPAEPRRPRLLDEGAVVNQAFLARLHAGFRADELSLRARALRQFRARARSQARGRTMTSST